MRAYVIRGLLLMIPTLFLVTLIVFFSVRFIPGDVIDLMVAEMAGYGGIDIEVTVENLRQALGMDLPVHVQYGHWLGDAVQGDLGESFRSWSTLQTLNGVECYRRFLFN